MKHGHSPEAAYPTIAEAVSMLHRLLSEIEPGCVRLVLSESPAQVLHELEAFVPELSNDDDSTPQFVGCAWNVIPVVGDLIADVLDALAEVALTCWPNWYAVAPSQRFQPSAGTVPDRADLLSLNALRAARVPVLEPWLQAAINCCQAGFTPRPNGFADPIQAGQLALAIDPARLVLLVVVTSDEQSSELLDGLARAGEWIARATGAPVAVVIPDTLDGNAALDSISFDALRLDAGTTAPEARPDSSPVCRPVPTATATDAVPVEQSSAAGPAVPDSPPTPSRPVRTPRSEGATLFVWPLQGVPHPRSEGERRLAQRLQQDDELATLFGFNQPVTTCRDSTHTVDLLWRGGRVVIEVDGYRWHSSREMFARDRHRDYELAISGYLVLRMTHEEVVRDVELAIEKIRDVVRYRRTGERPRT